MFRIGAMAYNFHPTPQPGFLLASVLEEGRPSSCFRGYGRAQWDLHEHMVAVGCCSGGWLRSDLLRPLPTGSRYHGTSGNLNLPTHSPTPEQGHLFRVIESVTVAVVEKEKIPNKS